MWKVAPLLLVVACGGKDPVGEDVLVLPRCSTPVAGTNITMRKIGNIGGAALLVTAPANDDRLFVVEQVGAIRIFVPDQVLLPEPFLDLSGDVGGPVIAGGEQGLLGLAFHPSYATNGLFFVTYTARNAGDPANQYRDVLARCSVSADPNKADPASCVDVLSIPDFAANHNGGMIDFGKDGYLYFATGDGGQANDPQHNGQAVNDGDPLPNTHALLAKMLRLDIDNKAPGLEYGIPADNPFAAGGGRPEIFMLGLRNAWRWAFDRETGDMWIGDVGQGTIEELDVVRAGEQKGKNFGWSTFEGNNCFSGPCPPTAGFFMPQDSRTHADGWVSITGGQVYRGTCYPDIVGTYFYTDYDDQKRLTKATLRPDGSLDITDLPGSFPAKGASLHDDGHGELYETDTDGNVFHLEAGP